MTDVMRIWYVSAQRLCNFRCTYCVSVGDYAKSNSEDWRSPDERERFERIVDWIAERPFRLGVRLATLGEPFASRPFLDRAAWLSRRPNVDFVELLTNGSLLRRRLEQLRRDGDISKISLWITHHPSQIGIVRFVENARIAQEEYGCFVVVNALLFPDNEDAVTALQRATVAAGLRFNLDLGYDPWTPHAAHTTLDDMIPVLREDKDGLERAVTLGADARMLELNVAAMRDLRGRSCRAGHDYVYIGIHGDVYRCSRYQALGQARQGNVLDKGFELKPNDSRWSPCEAGFGCGNKEDFLHLLEPPGPERATVPSLGWPGGTRLPGAQNPAPHPGI